LQIIVDDFVSAIVRFENGDHQNDIQDEDFGLHYPFAYVAQTWQAYRRFGVLPVAGGYNDQDEFLMQDWQTLDTRYQLKLQESKTGGLFTSNNRESLEAF
jgi:hypothetical protein